MTNDKSVRGVILAMYREHLPGFPEPEGKTLAELWPRVTRMDVAVGAALHVKQLHPMVWLGAVEVVERAVRYLGGKPLLALDAVRQSVLGKDHNEYPQGRDDIDGFMQLFGEFMAKKAGVSVEQIHTAGPPIVVICDWEVYAMKAVRHLIVAEGFRQTGHLEGALCECENATSDAIFSIARKVDADSKVGVGVSISVAHRQTLDAFRSVVTADVLEEKTTTMKPVKGLN